MPAKARIYRLSPLARADLEDIWRYTCIQWSPEQAESYHADLVAAFEGLASDEKIGLSVEDVRKGYWKHFVGAHTVYYRPSKHHLDIIRILHQSMDVSAHL